jgi:hypothetical protein
MNTDRIKQRLTSTNSQKSVNTDTYLKINLDGKEKLLPSDEINHIVNIGEQFNVERQRSKYYRILGTLNTTMSNALFNLDDSVMAEQYTWKGFNYRDPLTLDYRFLDTSYPKDNDILDKTDINYKEAINKYLLERDGWFGYTNPDKTQSGLCSFFDMEPKRERLSFVPDISPYHAPTAPPVKNWELTITYPKDTDKTHNMVAGGILLVEAEQAEVSTRNMTAFGVPCLHNLKIGDSVKITGTTGYDGEHVVIRTGLDNGDLQPYYFVIDKPFTAGTVSGSARFKRMFGGKESEYYFRKFRKVKTRVAPVIETDDYETYQLGFSENIFNDSITQFVFNEDIDVTDLTDNLGRPVSDLYLTIVKTDSNLLFGPISSGIETPFLPELNTSNINTYLQTIPAINKIHDSSTLPFPTHTPLEGNVTINNNNNVIGNNDFYGDLVEYNSNEVKETVLAEVSHRFNTKNRVTTAPINYVTNIGVNATTTSINLGPRQEGYFYRAHHKITIKEFSNYVEVGDQFTDGIPDYAVDLGDGRYLWRDLLEIGFNESNDVALDYPFLNGSHYRYANYCFHVRRQDPFDNWGLYWINFPSDPIGERMTDKFTINSAEDVC